MNKCVAKLMFLLLGLAPALTYADTYRSYEFTGTLATGSIDTTGAFGPIGANLSGDDFSGVVAIDLTTSVVTPDPEDGSDRSATTLLQDLTVNHVTQNLGNSAFTFDFVVDSYATSTSKFNFFVELADPVSFPDMDNPGTYLLNCQVQSCGDQLFSATLSTSAFTMNATSLTVTDSPTSPVPEPPTYALMLFGVTMLATFTAGTRRPKFAGRTGPGCQLARAGHRRSA